MSQQELLIRVVDYLSEAEIPYFLSGSVASSIYGEPRLTHDIDVVVAMGRRHIDSMMSIFPEADFYFDPESARSAIDHQDMFNIMDQHSGDKVDFWILTESDFDRSRLARVRNEQLFGREVALPSPEDVILSKLRWAKDSGGSEKQFQDALRIYEVQEAALDNEYLGLWAERLGVVDLLDAIRGG